MVQKFLKENTWMCLAGLTFIMLIISAFIAQYGHPFHYYGSRVNSLVAMFFHVVVGYWFLNEFLHNKAKYTEQLQQLGLYAGLAAGAFGVLLNFIELCASPSFGTSVAQWVLVWFLYAGAFATIGLAQPKMSKMQIAAFAAAALPLLGILISRLIAWGTFDEFLGSPEIVKKTYKAASLVASSPLGEFVGAVGVDPVAKYKELVAEHTSYAVNMINGLIHVLFVYGSVAVFFFFRSGGKLPQLKK